MDFSALHFIEQASAFSYLGIFGVGFLANIFVPVPEEIVLLVLGYVVGAGKLLFIPTVLVVILGALVSDLLMYELSLRGNKIVQAAYNRFFSKLVPLENKFVRTHIGKIIFISRFLIQFRFIGPFLAGRVRYPRKKFIKIDLLALCIYITFFIGAGKYFQDRIQFVLSGIGKAKNIILAILVLIILFTVIKFVRALILKYYKKLASPYEETIVPGLEKKKK